MNIGAYCTHFNIHVIFRRLRESITHKIMHNKHICYYGYSKI